MNELFPAREPTRAYYVRGANRRRSPWDPPTKRDPFLPDGTADSLRPIAGRSYTTQKTVGGVHGGLLCQFGGPSPDAMHLACCRALANYLLTELE